MTSLVRLRMIGPALATSARQSSHVLLRTATRQPQCSVLTRPLLRCRFSTHVAPKKPPPSKGAHNGVNMARGGTEESTKRHSSMYGTWWQRYRRERREERAERWAERRERWSAARKKMTTRFSSPQEPASHQRAEHTGDMAQEGAAAAVAADASTVSSVEGGGGGGSGCEAAGTATTPAGSSEGSTVDSTAKPKRRKKMKERWREGVARHREARAAKRLAKRVASAEATEPPLVQDEVATSGDRKWLLDEVSEEKGSHGTQ